MRRENLSRRTVTTVTAITDSSLVQFLEVLPSYFELLTSVEQLYFLWGTLNP